LTEFQRAELQARQAGYQSFMGVARAPLVERNFSTLVAKDEVRDRAEMATVYEDRELVNLRGWEPSIIHAAMKHLSDHYGLTGSDLAGAIAITTKRNRVLSGNSQACSYRTARGGFVLHDRTPGPDFQLGRIQIYVPGIMNPEELPTIKLSA
jgi:hypothetical protein